MGVDFNNSSMSYPRYDNFVTAVAMCFNGNANIYIPNDTDKNFYMFGYSNCGENYEVAEKFTFGKDVPECIVQFCNNPYKPLNSEEVKVLYNVLFLIKHNIHVVNEELYGSTVKQFIRELESAIEDECGLHIG